VWPDHVDDIVGTHHVVDALSCVYESQIDFRGKPVFGNQFLVIAMNGSRNARDTRMFTELFDEFRQK
jgi:hypothetical protein